MVALVNAEKKRYQIYLVSKNEDGENDEMENTKLTFF